MEKEIKEKITTEIEKTIKNVRDVIKFFEENKELIVEVLHGTIKAFELIKKVQEWEKQKKENEGQ